MIKSLWDAVNNRQNISINVLQERDVETLDVQGKHVVSISVRRATRLQRPVYIGDNPFKGSFRRNYEGDYHCDDATVRRMIADASQESSDGLVLEHFSLADIDLTSLAAYRQAFKATKPGHPWADLGEREFLRAIGGWALNREMDQEGLTLAGLLMFGRLPSILEAKPDYLIDYQEQSAADERIRWNDRLTTDGTWSGNLFDFYRQVYLKLTEALKVPFRMERDARRIDETVVHEAVREALVNTLVHADYHGRIGILVIRPPDRYSFRNPGTLRLPIELVYQGGISDCRNRTLQKMFQLIGVSEQAGSGIPKILYAWRHEHWRLPIIQENTETEFTTCILPMVSLFPPEAIERLITLFGDHFPRLPEAERLALATACIEGRVSNQRLQQLSPKHPHDLTLLLQHLVEQSFLKKFGFGRGTYYILNEDKETRYEEVPLFPEDTALVEKDATLTPEHTTFAAFIAQVRDSGKSSKEDIERAILYICQDEYISLKTIAALLHRAADMLRIRYIPRMVRAGSLRLRYPDKPHHPDQAYKAAQGKDEL